MTSPKKSATLNSLAKNYSKEDEARELLESLRWPGGVCCPRCGSLTVHKLTARPDSEHPVRNGVYKCKDCHSVNKKDQFTVTVGTIFEDSHIPLSKWLLAITFMCASKKGVSAHQLHRMLGITYKSAWFMAHRIRYAMQQSPIGLMHGTVEADETYVGGKRRYSSGAGPQFDEKTPVVALVQRNGDVRSFVVPTVSAMSLKEVLLENVHPSSDLMTDELAAYTKTGRKFASHQTVNHRKLEYVRGDVYTNSVEGYFGLLKRGINGVYHHVSREHLHRYLSEFDFRYNRRKIDDDQRTREAR